MEGYLRYKKISGKHHMYCPVREKKVILGKGCDDGDIAYFLPHQAPPEGAPSWERMGRKDGVTAEQEFIDAEVGEPDGVLKLVEKNGGWYDIENTATGEIINTTSLRKEEAEEIIKGYKPEEPEAPQQCPVEDGTFGEDFEEYGDCAECPVAADCEAYVPEKVEGDGE